MTRDRSSIDRPIILILDAGGINFVFSAMQGYQEVARQSFVQFGRSLGNFIAIGAYTFALRQLDAELNGPNTIAK